MVYRFLLTRRWLGLLRVALLVAVACVQLGRWQLHRLEARHAANHLIAEQRRRRTGPPQRAAPRRARAARRRRSTPGCGRTGRYDPTHQLLVRNRPLDGQVGYDVLVPLVTDAGPALLVNRGWVPGGASATELPKVPAAADRRRHGRRPAAAQRAGVDHRHAATAARSPASTSPASPATLPYAVYGGYGELTRRAARAAAGPRPCCRRPETSEGPHLAYAFQWFLFACMALGGYVVLARREAADRRARHRQRTDGRRPGPRVGGHDRHGPPRSRTTP